MTSPLTIQVETQGPVTLVRLTGKVSEENSFDTTLVNISRSKIVIDACGVRSINSFGTRDWMRWMQSLESRGNEIAVARCSPAMTVPVNLISNFLGSAPLLSVMAPYLCPSCSADKVVEVPIAGQGQVPPLLEVKCSECGEVMEFDDLPEAFFGFAKNHVHLKVDLAFRAALVSTER